MFQTTNQICYMNGHNNWCMYIYIDKGTLFSQWEIHRFQEDYIYAIICGIMTVICKLHKYRCICISNYHCKDVITI